MTLTRKTPIKRTAMKRKAPNNEFAFSVAVKDEAVRRANGRCEARTPWCTTKPRVFHHIRRRGPGKGTIENCLHICTACHNGYIHLHVNWAERHLMIVREGFEPDATKVVPGCPATCLVDHRTP